MGNGFRKAVCLLILLGGMSSTAIAQTDTAESSRPSFKVVLELFTSQGCSSCPPADALLESYTKRDDVIALSVPVDYWDRLGWKDTFASREFTLRQQEYASARGDGQVYTPQIVVSGSAHVVGSSRSSIDDAIAVAKRTLREFSDPVARPFGGWCTGRAGGRRPGRNDSFGYATVPCRRTGIGNGRNPQR